MGDESKDKMSQQQNSNAGTNQGEPGTDGGDPANTQQQGFSPEQANQLNRMITEHRKRDEKRLQTLVSEIVSQAVSTAISALPINQQQDSPVSGDDVEARVRREVEAKFEKRIAATEKALQESQRQLEQREAERKQEELLRFLRNEALQAGVREEMLDTLEAVVYHGPRKLLRRDDEGKPTFLSKAEWGDELIESPVSEGLKKFLKTPEGLTYLKADLRPGGGTPPRKSGQTNNAAPPPTSGLRAAKSPEEASKLLTEYFRTGDFESEG